MLSKIFFSINMTMKKVVVLAIGSALFSSVMLIIPFTSHTSLANPGTHLEFWIVLALIIIINCNSEIEAIIKTFVFFLISQPLIYLIQVPFVEMGWGIFRYYPRWFIFTLLTIPGSYIAYQVKKDIIIGSFVLGLATAFLAFSSFYFLSTTLDQFPKYLISTIFCMYFAFALVKTLLHKKVNRIIGYSMVAIGILLGIWVNILLMGFAFR